MQKNRCDFSWLQISDLHAGVNSQDWLWPNLKEIFFDDISRLHEKTGDWDVVIFSGDLTQSGARSEFEDLSSILERIWEHFDKLGFKPLLFCVPGNHDLARPSNEEPETLVMKRWWDEQVAQSSFWSSKESRYRKFAEGNFSEYARWLEKTQALGILPASLQHGLLPGDCSAVIDIGEHRIGLVGLNSAFLQISDSSGKGSLCVDPRQLLQLTEGSPADWCKRNSANLLVTHHPSSWLHPISQRNFNSEINPSGRFTAHIFGHMHEPDMLNSSHGGAPTKKHIQGPSLFGIKNIRDGEAERLHGYSVSQLFFHSEHITFKHWPRLSKVGYSGERYFVPDSNFFLNKETHIEETLPSNHSKISNPPDTHSPKNRDALQFSNPTADTNLLAQKASTLKANIQHLVIRRVEREECISSIQENRIAWICADWGLGVDGFLWATLKDISKESSNIYKINFSEYSDRETFLPTLNEQLGCSFQQFCKLVSDEPSAVFVFEDIPVGVNPLAEKKLETEIEGLSNAVAEYCPHSTVIILSRNQPTHTSIPHVTLNPLDEADTRAYVLSHEDGGSSMSASHIISDIYRLTDGVPNQIDSALRNLKFVSLSELTQLAYSPAVEKEISDNIPRALVKSVADLKDSSDPFRKRAFDLLKILTILPHGEYFQRIKRFDRTRQFYPSQVELLLQKGLVEPHSPINQVGKSRISAEQEKLLVVPRPVRDYVSTLLEESELRDLNLKASYIYFGEMWITGKPKLVKHSSSVTDGDGIALNNPHAIIQRLLIEEVDILLDPLNENDEKKRRLSLILKVAKIYCNQLQHNDNFRSCATACKDFLSIVPPEFFPEERNWLSYTLARCLRMIGRTEESRDMLRSLISANLDKTTKQQIYLNLAFCLSTLDDPDAMAMADKVEEIEPKNGASIQAKALKLELSPHDEDTFKKLKALEAEARSKGYTTAANGIALTCIETFPENGNAKSALKQVSASSMEAADYYSAARAAIKVGHLANENNENLTGEEINNLIRAYHYVHNERFDSLFMRAHKALWAYFERENELSNLLRLFRHSSFIWRLEGDDEKEKPYIDSLIERAPGLLTSDIRQTNTETAYFIRRSNRHDQGGS